MDFKRGDLVWAAEQGILSPDQAERLWDALSTRVTASDEPRFDFVNLLYYFGAMLVILAMAWFLSISWDAAGPGGLLAISLVYAVGFTLAARNLWYVRALHTPGGLLATVAVSMVPLVTYSIEKLTGLWPEGSPGSYQDFHVFINGGWTGMELATIAAGLVMLRFFPFSFLTAPISFCLWYLSMDLCQLLLGKNVFDFHQQALFSTYFGLVMLVCAYLLDLNRATDTDYSYWLYIFGMLTFWVGLTCSGNGSELGYLLYACGNLGLMVVSVLLQRRVFIVFGSFGVIGYLGHLAYHLFKDAFFFPIALSLIGLITIWAAIQLKQHSQAFTAWIERMVPDGARRFIPARS